MTCMPSIFLISGMEDYRRICEDYRMFWYDDEEDIYEEKSMDLKTLEVWKET